MKSIVKKIGRFLRAEDGPTAVEYAFILILIIVVCLTAVKMIGDTTNGTLQNSGNEITNVVTGGT
ncbi:MAG: Flp family type IVb pilin [Pirellulales bacterium]|nr:Flp family type IVb pilin [Pirellulales bacterium]